MRRSLDLQKTTTSMATSSAALQPARHDERMDTYGRGDLTFGVLDEGPPGGPVVVLLHGFPQQNTSWNTVIPRLTEEGYRCLAPNQRGYSRTARPRGRWNYRTSELVAAVPSVLPPAVYPVVALGAATRGPRVCRSGVQPYLT
jgi:pimeloyl-ACP methyl ester carboxylesterase